jgi:hypothetical protein
MALVVMPVPTLLCVWARVVTSVVTRAGRVVASSGVPPARWRAPTSKIHID